MYKIIEFPTLPSTHEYAKKHASSLHDGDVILAHTQTQGRGRKDRQWISHEGGLYFTLLLKPARCPYPQNLTQLLCLSICQTLEDLVGITAAVKWPNDVLLQGKKLAGILSEAVFAGTSLTALMVGAGVNIGQEKLPIEGKAVTSLKIEGYEADRAEFLEKTLFHYFNLYEAVLLNGFSAIQSAYLARIEYLHEKIKFISETECIEGVLQTVSDTGNLVVRLENGCTREVLMGEIL